MDKVIQCVVTHSLPIKTKGYVISTSYLMQKYNARVLFKEDEASLLPYIKTELVYEDGTKRLIEAYVFSDYRTTYSERKNIKALYTH